MSVACCGYQYVGQIMRNGVLRPPERRGGLCGAATTSPPAVMAYHFQKIASGLKARRTATKDQHLCHLGPVSIDEILAANCGRELPLATEYAAPALRATVAVRSMEWLGR